MSKIIIREILELLRGKTIVDKIVLCYGVNISEKVMYKIPHDNIIDIIIDDNCINLVFKQGFLVFIEWPYYSIVNQIQRITGKTKTLNIYARSLFADKENIFILKFDDTSLAFMNKENIEDTLFLDILRYCEYNKIDLGVI